MASIPLPVHSYRLRSTTASTARLVNCYAEQLPPDAKTPILLGRTPGINARLQISGAGPVRAMHAALGALFVVAGSNLYRVASNFAPTLLGSIGTPGNLDMAANTSAVVVVNEPNMFYWDGTTFGQVTDPDFLAIGGANSVEFVDNFLTFTVPDSDEWGCFDLGSATSFDALNFASAEGAPDRLRGHKVDHRQALLLGEETGELWENVGQAGFPFARVPGGFIEIGCFNGRTAVKLDNSIVWVANDYTVRRLEGATPVRISTHAVEQFLTRVTMASGSAFAYTQDGHLFYVLTFPEGTFVYDSTTKEWHERQTYGFANWVASCHAQAFGQEIVGHGQNNEIGALDSTVYTDFGLTNRMEWTYQPVMPESKDPIFHDRLDIVVETGVGLTTGQGSIPEIMLDYSDDGGKTWLFMPNREIGRIGDYLHQVSWTRLGSSRKPRVFRGAVSDPVRVNITDTQWTGRGGRIARAA
jgi:hypothetical protein